MWLKHKHIHMYITDGNYYRFVIMPRLLFPKKKKKKRAVKLKAKAKIGSIIAIVNVDLPSTSIYVHEYLNVCIYKIQYISTFILTLISMYV